MEDGRQQRQHHRGASEIRSRNLMWTSTPCAQEYVNGQLKNHYGDAFIRGNNGAALCWL